MARTRKTWAATFGAIVLSASPALAQGAGVGPPLHPRGSAVVHLDATDNVTLEAQHGSAWAVVCAAPCDQRLPLDIAYRLNGSARTSAPFRIIAPESEDHVVLTAKPSSSFGFGTGVVFTILGGLGMFLGAGSVAVDGIEWIAHPTLDPKKVKDGSIPAILLGAGAAAALLGIAFIALNGPSTVDQPHPVQPEPLRSSSPAEQPEALGAPAPLMFPILSATF